VGGDKPKGWLWLEPKDAFVCCDRAFIDGSGFEITGDSSHRVEDVILSLRHGPSQIAVANGDEVRSGVKTRYSPGEDRRVAQARRPRPSRAGGSRTVRPEAAETEAGSLHGEVICRPAYLFVSSSQAFASTR
jgi:hypothetical protein